MQSRRSKRTVAGVIACVLCLVVGFRIYQVNQQVSNVPEKIYDMGEKVPFEDDVFYIDSMKGYSLTILSAEVKTTEQFLEEYGASMEDIPEANYTPKVYDLEVEVANDNNVETGINLYEMQLRNNAAYAGFDEVYYRIANKEKGYQDISIAVQPGTSVTMHWIFIMPEQCFSKQAYENIENLDLKLVMSLYPTKKMIRLK